MNAAQREPYLAAVDAVLLPLGYRRRKSAQEWQKSGEGKTTCWLHLNFGLAVINPSFGVRFHELESLLPIEAGAIVGTMEILSTVSGVSYHQQSSPLEIASHIRSHVLAGMQALQDRNALLARLESASGPWPVAGASARMRLLPLLLAAQGDVQAALNWLAYFEQHGLQYDQHLPGYGVFAAHFRQQYADD